MKISLLLLYIFILIIILFILYRKTYNELFNTNKTLYLIANSDIDYEKINKQYLPKDNDSIVMFNHCGNFGKVFPNKKVDIVILRSMDSLWTPNYNLSKINPKKLWGLSEKENKPFPEKEQEKGKKLFSKIIHPKNYPNITWFCDNPKTKCLSGGTTGFLALQYFLNYENFDKIVLVGFSFYKNDTSKTKQSHDGTWESNYFYKNIKNNNITVIKPIK